MYILYRLLTFFLVYIHVWQKRNAHSCMVRAGISEGLWKLRAPVGLEGQFVSRLFLPPWYSWILPHQSRKAMTSVLTSQSKIAMLTLLLLILTTLQENISATRSNQTLIRSKRYATHLNPIYRHFDFLKRDGNYFKIQAGLLTRGPPNSRFIFV